LYRELSFLLLCLRDIFCLVVCVRVGRAALDCSDQRRELTCVSIFNRRWEPALRTLRLPGHIHLQGPNWRGALGSLHAAVVGWNGYGVHKNAADREKELACQRQVPSPASFAFTIVFHRLLLRNIIQAAYFMTVGDCRGAPGRRITTTTASTIFPNHSHHPFRDPHAQQAMVPRTREAIL
jgi:hypothetical protein